MREKSMLLLNKKPLINIKIIENKSSFKRVKCKLLQYRHKLQIKH